MKETFLLYSGFDADEEYRTYLDAFHKKIVGQKIGLIGDSLANGDNEGKTTFSRSMQALAHTLLAVDIEARLIDATHADWSKALPEMNAMLIQSHSLSAATGSLQGCFDVFTKPYTGSGVAPTALAYDREWLMAVLGSAGVAVHNVIGTLSDLIDEKDNAEDLPKSKMRILVSKKRNIFSSGVAFRTDKSAQDILNEFGKAPRELLVGELEESRSLCVAVVGVREGWLLLPPFWHAFPYDDSTSSALDFPTLESDRLQDLYLQTAKIFKAVNCDGFCIVEFVIQGSQEVLFDVHLAPSLAPEAAIVQAAQYAGLSHQTLLLSVLARAYKRYEAGKLPRR